MSFFDRRYPTDPDHIFQSMVNFQNDSLNIVIFVVMLCQLGTIAWPMRNGSLILPQVNLSRIYNLVTYKSHYDNYPTLASGKAPDMDLLRRVHRLETVANGEIGEYVEGYLGEHITTFPGVEQLAGDQPRARRVRQQPRLSTNTLIALLTPRDPAVDARRRQAIDDRDRLLYVPPTKPDRQPAATRIRIRRRHPSPLSAPPKLQTSGTSTTLTSSSSSASTSFSAGDARDAPSSSSKGKGKAADPFANEEALLTSLRSGQGVALDELEQCPISMKCALFICYHFVAISKRRQPIDKNNSFLTRAFNKRTNTSCHKRVNVTEFNKEIWGKTQSMPQVTLTLDSNLLLLLLLELRPGRNRTFNTRQLYNTLQPQVYEAMNTALVNVENVVDVHNAHVNNAPPSYNSNINDAPNAANTDTYAPAADDTITTLNAVIAVDTLDDTNTVLNTNTVHTLDVVSATTGVDTIAAVAAVDAPAVGPLDSTTIINTYPPPSNLLSSTQSHLHSSPLHMCVEDDRSTSSLTTVHYSYGLSSSPTPSDDIFDVPSSPTAVASPCKESDLLPLLFSPFHSPASSPSDSTINHSTIDDELLRLASSPSSCTMDDDSAIDDELLQLASSPASMHKRPRSPCGGDVGPVNKKLRLRDRQKCQDLSNLKGDPPGVNVEPLVAHYWHPDCNRNGSRSRQAAASNLPQWPSDAGAPNDNNDGHANFFCRMDEELTASDNEAQEEGCRGWGGNDADYVPDEVEDDNGGVQQDSGNSKKKKKTSKNAIQDKFVSWKVDGVPPPITSRAQRALIILSTITLPENFDKAAKLLLSLSTDQHNQNENESLDLPQPSSASTTLWGTFRSLSNRCCKLEKNVQVNDFNFMVAQVQLALYYDIVCNDAILKGSKRPSKATISSELCTSYDRFRNWVEAGTRLAFLCAAGTPFILVVIACVGLRINLSERHNTSNEDIYDIGFYLRDPQVGHEVGALVKKTLLPFLLVHFPRIPIYNIVFPFVHPSNPGSIIACPFDDFVAFDDLFRQVETMYYPLPNRLQTDLPPLTIPSTLPSLPFIASDSVVVKLPTAFTQTKCPVTCENRKPWTSKERIQALQAEEIMSIDDLIAKLPEHRGRAFSKGKYMKIHSSICEGRTLKLLDANDKFAGLLITHMLSMFPNYNNEIIDYLSAVFPNEFRHDDSQREHYKFLSLHYSWYSRYAEKGDGAPIVHPHYVYKEGSIKVNTSQRVPRCSNDIQDDPQEHDVLAMLLKNVFKFVDENLKHHLPDEYHSLIAYVENLPLRSTSPAYPFGGFVINISVSTHGHRDFGDKILCVVVPFGQWTGGELCLFEPGLVIGLSPGDVFIFPSGDFTHFNLHYEGTRMSLVLHSDKQGDKWVKNCNGWNIIRRHTDK
ncbi:hypothetical protein H0H93_013295 [Arthromyces matolae]|nr:hypothetical protein H0H93_013295 [Arthromyces matolae]